MQVVHVPDVGAERVLADRVRVADGFLAKTRGLVGSRPLDTGEAVVFRFRRAGTRRVHTLLVREAIDVLWITNETIGAVETIEPWSLGDAASGDTVVELPRDAAAGIEPGAIVRLEGIEERSREARAEDEA